MLTTKKIATGKFECFWNGVNTGVWIINGSRVLPGRDTRNVYGIVWRSGKISWIGSLVSCKKTVESHCEKTAT